MMSRIPETEENKLERDNTDREERTAQINELIDTVTKDGHPVLNNLRPVHEQLEKGGTNYEYRARHERYMIDLNYKFYLPISCLEWWLEPLDCSFYEVPRNPEEAHHRKFGTNGDTMLRDHDKRTLLRRKKASGVRSKCQYTCSKIERRNGKRKDNRWEKHLTEDEQKIKNARRAHKSQECRHCGIEITQKANSSQAWTGPPGAHEDCDKCDQIHTKMEYHLEHQCKGKRKIHEPKEAPSEEHKRKRAATGCYPEHPKKRNSLDGRVPQYSKYAPTNFP